VHPFSEKVIPNQADAQKNNKQSRSLKIKENGNGRKENASYQEMLVNHRKDDHHRQKEKPEVQLREYQRFFFIE
jgi:hypothetical protein